MRKVVGYRRAWLPFGNAFSASRPRIPEPSALKSERGLGESVPPSSQRQGLQPHRNGSAKDPGIGLQMFPCRRTRCTSAVYVPCSNSRSFSFSTQSLQLFSPIASSGDQVRHLSSGDSSYLCGAPDSDHSSYFKVRTNSNSAADSEFFGGGRFFCTVTGHVENHVHTGKSPFSADTCGMFNSSFTRRQKTGSPECLKEERVTGSSYVRDGEWNSPIEGTLEDRIHLAFASSANDERKDVNKDLALHTEKEGDTLQIRSRRNQSNSRLWEAGSWSIPFVLRSKRSWFHVSGATLFNNAVGNAALRTRSYSTDASTQQSKSPEVVDHSQRAVVVALWCNFLVFSLKVGVYIMTSSHVMLAEAVHSLADLANQGLLAYGLYSSRRAPDAQHPYGYIKERFVWSLISAVGIFCLGAGATIVHGVQNLGNAEPLANISLAAGVIAGSMLMEGASFVVAYGAVKKGAAAEGMTLKEYLWRGHDPTSVAVLMEDGAAVLGLCIAGLALATAEVTGNPIWDPVGSILVGNLLAVVAIFLIQRNRQALLGRSIDDVEMRRIINLLIADPVVEGLYDCKSEVIGPGAYRFKAEIDFNGVVIVQNYLQRAGRETWMREFREAVNNPDGSILDRVMAEYGEEVVSALGSEVDRLEKDIQRIVPGILHVDIEAHNPNGPAPREKFYLY